MNYWSRNLVRLGNGEPAAEYIVSVPDETLENELKFPNSKLRELVQIDRENEKHFKENAAWSLGWLVCKDEYSRRYFQNVGDPWMGSKHRVEDVEVLTEEPKNLGQPTFFAVSDKYPELRIWLMKSWIADKGVALKV